MGRGEEDRKLDLLGDGVPLGNQKVALSGEEMRDPSRGGNI